METWKTIPKAPNYAVSDLGRVKRIARGKRTHIGFMPRIWGKNGDPTSYQNVTLLVDKKHCAFTVHRLVMEVFRGPSDLQVNHINGLKTDNRLENLEYVTASQNQQHSIHTIKTFQMGITHHNAKLCDDDVREMFKLKASGETPKLIAKRFGVSPENVRYILKRATWKHVVL